MIRVYTAGPYRSKHWWGVLANIYSAWYIARELWRQGYAVLCPHANTILMSEGPGKVAVPNFLKGDLDLLKMCDVVLMLPGWQNSAGSIGEKDFARVHGIPVVYSVDELNAKRRELELCRV